TGPHPSDDLALLVSEGTGSTDVPPIQSAGPLLQAKLDLVVLPSPNRAIPAVLVVGQIFRMQHRSPAEGPCLFEGHPGAVVPVLAAVLQPTVGPGGPDDMRQDVHQKVVARSGEICRYIGCTIRTDH